MSVNGQNGSGATRIDAPLYVAKYRERQATKRVTDRELAAPGGESDTDSSVPLYLRRFRQRDTVNREVEATPLWGRAGIEMQRALTEDSLNKEISAPPEALQALHNDAYLIRHGETQGYSTDSGLTPQGAWQCHTYGRTLAKRLKSGETIVFRHARTNRARETAEQVHRGLLDGMSQFEKDIAVHEPEPMDEFANFQFAAPDGLRDVTAAFRHYYAVREDFERRRTGDRPLWLVEMDRFWSTQQGGGDPIEHWLTVPMLHFEPPAMCVRRFWAGINKLSDEFEGARLAIATHSGPIRAFAVAALGYDPGEPYNVEHVRVKILAGREEALVAYRNRVQETRVPELDALPDWSLETAREPSG